MLNRNVKNARIVIKGMGFVIGEKRAKALSLGVLKVLPRWGFFPVTFVPAGTLPLWGGLGWGFGEGPPKKAARASQRGRL